MNKLCPYCKKPVEDSAIFCPHCNLQIAEHKAPMRKTTPTLPKQASPTPEKRPVKNTVSPTSLIIWIISLLSIVAAFITVGIINGSIGLNLKTPVTSSDDPELRCEKLHDYSNANSFWKFAYENIPTVTYDEAISGDYDSSYICIDGVFLSNYSVEFSVAFPSDSDSYVWESFLPDDAIGNDLIDDMKDGDSIKLCVFIQNGHFSYHPKALCKIKKTFDFNVTEYRQTKQKTLKSGHMR